ncbi:MAG: DUF881 domain-containing protein [Firmicutes bacterium]|nr:DUF881 domain-containing protein [Bacillota bacterium]
MKLARWQISVTLICIITGLFISFNLKAQSALKTVTSQTTAGLAGMVEKTENENIALEAEIHKLRSQLDTRQKAEATDKSLIGLQIQLDKAKLVSGLTSLEGKGLTITLNDRNLDLQQTRKSGQEINYWDYLVHDSDLVKLVNDLKVGGAEAIAINGERMTTPSDIKCGGYIVYSNGTRLGAPYVLTAIGDPNKLEAAVKHGTTYTTLSFLEYPLTVTKMDTVIVPSYKGGFKLSYSNIIR